MSAPTSHPWHLPRFEWEIIAHARENLTARPPLLGRETKYIYALGTKLDIYIYIYTHIYPYQNNILLVLLYGECVHQKNLTKHWNNEVHFIFGSTGHKDLWLSNLKVMYVYPIGKNEQTLNYWCLGNGHLFFHSSFG